MDISDQLANELKKGINKLNLNISLEKQTLLLEYLNQLHKWNQAFNLSGIKDIQKMLKLHILDSLSIMPFIEGSVILDVGTGAGLPGFVLAICFPEKKFILLDSNGKKTRFMFQAASSMGLSNIEVVNKRAEDYQSLEQIDIVVSRAFTSLKQFVAWIKHLVNQNTQILAMKGVYPEGEIAELEKSCTVKQSHSLSIPGEETSRHLLVLEINPLKVQR